MVWHIDGSTISIRSTLCQGGWTIVMGDIHHLSSYQSIGHAIFYGSPCLNTFGLPNVPLWKVGSRRKMDGSTPTYKILTSFGKAQYRLILPHIQYSPSRAHHLMLVSTSSQDRQRWEKLGRGEDLVQKGLGIHTICISGWLHYRISGPGTSGSQQSCWIVLSIRQGSCFLWLRS